MHVSILFTKPGLVFTPSRMPGNGYRYELRIQAEYLYISDWEAVGSDEMWNPSHEKMSSCLQKKATHDDPNIGYFYTDRIVEVHT
jgi:hypothetical protein